MAAEGQDHGVLVSHAKPAARSICRSSGGPVQTSAQNRLALQRNSLCKAMCDALQGRVRASWTPTLRDPSGVKFLNWNVLYQRTSLVVERSHEHVDVTVHSAPLRPRRASHSVEHCIPGDTTPKGVAHGRISIQRFFLFTLITFFTSSAFAQPALDRHVTIHAEQVRLSQALELVAKDAALKLSYNAAVVPMDSIVTLHVEEQPVDRVLRGLLPKRAQWKVSGQHLIITGQAGARQRFNSTGRVVEATSGAPIPHASILDVQRGNVVGSGPNGEFSMELSGELDRTPLRIARQGYRDTVVYVPRNGDAGRVALSPLTRLEYLEPICLNDRCGVEDLGVAKLLVPEDRLQQNVNLGGGEWRNAQLSLVPGVSTNGPLAASIVNRASFNVLGGYARGVDGAEIGGGFNLLSENLNGFQASGAANLVGGRTRGVQVSGGFNHTMGSLYGLQLAGASNTVWDTLSGVQVAGGVNVVKRGMHGTQVAGAVNVTLGDQDGVQIAGGVNVAHGVVRKSQVAGGLNYARSVQGAQVAAGANVSLGEVGGGQVGFGANYARSVSGGQVSFGANVVPGEVSGGQVGFGLNYAHRVTGGQFSFGANVVPGEVSGGQVAFGLNYAHRVTKGQFSFGANIVPGTVEAGQVGFGLNYAHHVTKGQFSFGANVVPGTAEGGQVGFGLNYANDVKGGQFTFGANVVADTADGGQVGVLNYARHALGVQVGILNLSDTLAAGAVGLLTISRTGYHRADVVANGVMPIGIQVRTGTRAFHNILGFSPPTAPDGRWGFLYGFGTEPRLGKRWVLNIDLTGEQVVEQEEWVDAVNILGRFSISAGVYFGDRFILSAGPVLNTLVSDLRDRDTGVYTSTLPPQQPLFTDGLGGMQINGWIGWKAGVGVRF